MRRKRLLSCIALYVLLCSSVVISVNVVSMWDKTYGGASSERAYSLIETSDGGYALVGYYQIMNTSQTDFWLIKTDEFGIFPEYNS